MPRGSLPNVLLAGLSALLAGAGVATGCALTLAVIDIYLAGHGQATLGRPWIDGAFIHMSRADAILLPVSLSSALVVGWAVWRSARA